MIDTFIRVFIYPNPVVDRAHIEFAEPLEEASIQIFDISGKLLTEQAIQQARTEINLESLNASPQLYIYRVMNNGVVVKRGKLIR